MAPDHWARRPCGEVCTVNRANLPSSTDPHEVIKYVSIGSVPGPGQINGMDEMEVQAAPSRAKRLVQDGDVLVGTVRPYLKSFVLLRDPPDNLVVSTGFAVLTPSKEMDPDFLYQVVCSPEFVAQLTSRMKGSSYPAVNVRDVKETMLPVPPLQEQERIAKILSSVDNAVAEAKAVVRQMSRLRQAMIDTLALKGTCNSELCESPIGKVPAGWEVVSLKDLTEGPIRNGYSPVCPDEPTGRWILSLGALGPDGLDTHEVKPAPEGDARVNDFLLQSGDFLVSRSNTRERVGWSALFRGEVTDCAYPDLMMRFRVNLNLICPEYLEAYLYSTPACQWRVKM